MKLIYFSTYSLIYPEVLKTLTQNFAIDQVICHKKGLSPDTTDKKLILYKKQLELQLNLINPSISIEFQEIPQTQDLKDPEHLRNYIESLINSQYSSLPKETIFFMETLAINHMKWKLEKLSNSYTFILFTNKHKGNLDQSLGGQNWKRIRMLHAETEKSVIEALKRAYKEQTDARFDHTIRVIEFANQISSWCSFDESTKAKLLLSCAYHDFCKNWTKTKLLSYAFKIYPKSKQELESEIWSLHGPVAKYYLSKTFNLDDSILNAIEHHTKPVSNLDIVGKALVVADKLEPNKKESLTKDRYDFLFNQLKEGKIEEVFKYLLENPIKS